MRPKAVSWLVPILMLGVLPGFAAEETAASTAAERRTIDATIAESASAFVRSHADSLVKWMPWGDAAWSRAKRENRPLYVVVGAFTSELGRAMRQQSFGNAEIAAQLNENFVCVLVDRDEHPRVAASLANYVQAAKQLAGWPLNVWLTPELKPFEGATYLPPSEEWGRQGITNLIKSVATAWAADPAEVRARAEQALVDLAAAADEAIPAAPLNAEKIDAAFAARRAAADPQHGAVGEPPRALEPELWAAQLARGGGDRELALVTLRALLASPTHDPLDGGFFRASGDAAWRRPVWVKTAADQARMALALLAAGDDPVFREAARAALKFALSELRTPEGEFITSVDALDEANAVAMTWPEADVKAAVDEKDAPALLAALGVTSAGNVAEADDASGKLRGRNYLALAPADSANWTEALKKLRAARTTKVRWARDTNCRLDVNGLMLGALARASVILDDAELRDAASRLAAREIDFVKTVTEVRRLRSGGEGAAIDVAGIAWGLGEWAKVAKSEPAAKLAAQLWTDFGKTRLEMKGGRFVATGSTLAEGWRPAPALPSIVGELPALEWLVGASGDAASQDARTLAARRCAVALDDPGGSPPADVLAAVTLLLR